MNIKLAKNNYIECDELQLYNNKIIISNNKYSLNKYLAIIKENDKDLNLFFLYNEFNRIRKLNKFNDFLIIFSNQIEGIFIEFSINNKNNTTQNITIYIGYDFIYNTSENDILVFFCHELGHLIDGENINKSHNNITIIKKSSSITLTVLLLLNLIYYKNQTLLLLSGFLFLFIFKLIINKIIFLIQQKFSRNQEFKADEFAVYLMRSPEKVLESYQFLQKIFNQPENNSINDSHPTLPQRINYIKKHFWFALFINKIFKI